MTTRNETETQTNALAAPRRSRFAALALGLTLIGAPIGVAIAGPGGGGPGHGFFGGGRGDKGDFVAYRMEKMLGKAGASDQQKAQIRTIFEELRPQMEPIQTETREIRRNITAALAAPNVDTTRVEALRKQSVALMDKASALTTGAMVKAAQVLTSEQRAKLATELEQRRGGRRE